MRPRDAASDGGKSPRIRSDNDGPVDIHPSATAENAQIERLLETVRIQPGTASAHFSLGVLYLNRRDFHKASDAFSAAIALEPHDGEAWRHRGLARIGLGDFTAARSDLDKAISLDPDDSDGYRARAEAQVELGNFVEALADCTVALRANGHDAGALHIRGMALAGLKQYKSAITSLNSAINADPNRAEFYADRSRMLECSATAAAPSAIASKRFASILTWSIESIRFTIHILTVVLG